MDVSSKPFCIFVERVRADFAEIKIVFWLADVL